MKKSNFVILTLLFLLVVSVLWLARTPKGPDSERFNGRVDLNGTNLNLKVVAFAPPVFVPAGGEFPSKFGDWAITYNHRLPSQCLDHMEWRSYATSELADVIAPGGKFPNFQQVARQTERTYSHYIEVVSEGLRQICLVGESEVVVGSGHLTPSAQVLVWNDGWKNHVKDETGLISAAPVTDIKELLQWLGTHSEK
jgi:hypothetical protein